jgi:hypothetical protein
MKEVPENHNGGFYFFHLFLFSYCYGGTFTKVLIISYLNSSPQPFSFIPPPVIPRIVSTGIIFSFTYMCTQYLHNIHPPMTFLHFLPLPLVPASPRQVLFHSLVLWFSKRKISGIFACLRLLHRKFHCGTSMYICIIARIGSALFFFFLP